MVKQARSLSVIAREIKLDWKKVHPTAKPYLDAFGTLTTIHDKYYQDNGQAMVIYFLSNAQSWRGDVARTIKKELNAMIKF
jgi:hypothetical protein